MVLSQKRINMSQEDQSNSGMSLLIRAYHNSIITLYYFGPTLHNKMKPAKLFAQYDVIAWCLCTTIHTLCPIYRSVWYPSYNQQSCLVVVWCLCTTIHTLCPIYNLVWYTTIQPVLSCMVVYHANMIALGANTLQKTRCQLLNLTVGFKLNILSQTSTNHLEHPC